MIHDIELVMISLDDRKQPTIYMGDYDPIQGWISPSYGVLREAPVIVHEENTTLPVKLVTGIFFGSIHKRGALQSTKGNFEILLEKLIQKGYV
jgi:hypothetical protein